MAADDYERVHAETRAQWRRWLDPSRSILVGSGPAHRTLAATLGARYLPVRA